MQIIKYGIKMQYKMAHFKSWTQNTTFITEGTIDSDGACIPSTFVRNNVEYKYRVETVVVCIRTKCPTLGQNAIKQTDFGGKIALEQ